ncbi:MAG: DUF4007 family protein [Caldilineaceae bacterium]|nr:DUF4007 family protein [Caldilineaceae bacterium]
MNSLRFSGHESFACRYAWLPKAYRAIIKDPNIFSDQDRAMVSLGVGKNMVRSIRFWVEIMGVADPLEDRTLEPTRFGEKVFDDRGFDPFLEDIRTLWLLHWNVAARLDDPLFAWDYLLHKWPYIELTRSEALGAFKRESRRLNKSRSEVTLGEHLDIFLHTYVPKGGNARPSEESLDCPLAELELLQVVGDRRVDGSGRREPVYAFRREAKPDITMALFEYCLNDYWENRFAEEATLTYRDVAFAPGSIGQIFKLPEDDIRARLDAYTMPDSGLPFVYQPSAVQGLISRRDTRIRDFLTAVYIGEDSNACATTS